ncbi:MAG TPA: hypothetical protein VLU25_07220 [Acidobacteriota bacterium]|nr:hypothetical protein [Acidobacteriota bacterium]
MVSSEVKSRQPTRKVETMTILEKLERLERVKADPAFAALCRQYPEWSRVVEKLERLRRENPGAVRDIEAILEALEELDFDTLAALKEQKEGKAEEWGSFFRTARSMKLEGPADWSERFEEYLYGDHS